MITIDFETRSEIDIRTCGSSVYARDDSTSILCLAWSLEGQGQEEEPNLWTPDQKPPQDLINYVLLDPGPVEAHNVGFERQIWHWICHKRLGWPDIPFDRWRCSMAACSRLALPRSLEAAGEALGLGVTKDKEGHRIMLRLCKPKNPSKKDPGKWDNDPVKFERLYKYCKQDVQSEIAISRAIPQLEGRELEVWKLDQRINLRGLSIDLRAIHLAIDVIQCTLDGYCKELSHLTVGKVTSPTQVAKLAQYLREVCGFKMPSLSAEVVENVLAREDIPERVRPLLEIRQKASKSSTAKLNAMLERCDSDGRVRGCVVYHGAHTGRWSGAGIQIQNFPRGSLAPYEIDLTHQILQEYPPEQAAPILDLLLANPMDCISSSLRSMIQAPEGRRLLVCDFASIEARTLAWLAGEKELLQAFVDGADVYVSMASKIYEVPEAEVTKGQRFVGKTAILGLGYGMGHKAFQAACKAMAGVDIERKFSKQVIKTYRKSNPRIRSLWSDLSTAAIRAVETKQLHRAGKLKLTCDDSWLQIELPSGRKLHYWSPEVILAVAPWSKGHVGDIHGPESLEGYLESLDIELGERRQKGWINCDLPAGAANALSKQGVKHDLEKKEIKMIKQLRYRGVDSITRKWKALRTYGGKLVENVTQATARDFLVEAMFRVEEKGYPIVATVHDEIISERKIGEGSLQEFESLMSATPPWGRGCPLAVEGFEAKRYRK